MPSGVIAASDPRAAEAAADVLSAGGNAVDAAVAAVLVLFVVEPHGCGPGGDAFLLVLRPGGPVEALDGSGAVPAGLTEEALVADGLENVPVNGARSVTVPGAVGLLEEALARYGTRSLREVVGPAIDCARDGFAARRTLAESSARLASQIRQDPVLGPLYVPEGRPVQVGDRITNLRLAALLEQIAEQGSPTFYEGPIAEAVVERVRALGGYLSLQDMQSHRTSPVDPVSTKFGGATVWELPLPTQGPAVLAALDLIYPETPIDWDDARQAIISGLRSAGIDVYRKLATPGAAPRDTSYLAVVDEDGLAASMITSVFSPFGSLVGLDALGGPIHNRATTFYALGIQPRPGKPPHTTIPCIVTRDGELLHVLGLAGGYVQAQVQVQLILRLLVEGLEPQQAIDAPRMAVLFGGDLALEPDHPLGERYPEAIGRPTPPEGFGAAQVASRRGTTLAAGADARRDGVVVFV